MIGILDEMQPSFACYEQSPQKSRTEETRARDEGGTSERYTYILVNFGCAVREGTGEEISRLARCTHVFV